jgi:hypothetical protein
MTIGLILGLVFAGIEFAWMKKSTNNDPDNRRAEVHSLEQEKWRWVNNRVIWFSYARLDPSLKRFVVQRKELLTRLDKSIAELEGSAGANELEWLRLQRRLLQRFSEFGAAAEKIYAYHPIIDLQGSGLDEKANIARLGLIDVSKNIQALGFAHEDENWSELVVENANKLAEITAGTGKVEDADAKWSQLRAATFAVEVSFIRESESLSMLAKETNLILELERKVRALK